MRAARRLLLPMALLAAAALAPGCAGRHRSSIELAPFVEVARESICADIRRRLFVIDDSMVLFDRTGSCHDNRYSRTLYGRSPEEVLCTTHDSIAGPMTSCAAGAPREMFETINLNPDSPDLGLGADHKVRPVPID